MFQNTETAECSFTKQIWYDTTRMTANVLEVQRNVVAIKRNLFIQENAGKTALYSLDLCGGTSPATVKFLC